MRLEELLDSKTLGQPNFDSEWLASLPLGRIDIVIRADGAWEYAGTPFTRPAMVDLLASHLLLRDGEYCLVAPEQLLRIRVDDCPFVITLADRECARPAAPHGQRYDIHLATNLGHSFVLDRDAHPMSLSCLPGSEQRIPTVVVSRDLPARVSRAAYYQLASWVDREADSESTEALDALQVESACAWHTIGFAD